MDGKKPSLIIALGKSKPMSAGPKAAPGAPAAEPDDDEDMGMPDDLDMAAGELKTAIASGDDAAIAEAFRAMHDICSSY